MRESSHEDLAESLAKMAPNFGVNINLEQSLSIVAMMIERVSFLGDIFESKWLFDPPSKESYNIKMVKKKWKDETSSYMEDMKGVLEGIEDFKADIIEGEFKAYIESHGLGFGQVLLPFRIALTGSGGGPSMFEFAEFLGKEATLSRIEKGIGTVALIKEELKV